MYSLYKGTEKFYVNVLFSLYTYADALKSLINSKNNKYSTIGNKCKVQTDSQ